MGTLEGRVDAPIQEGHPRRLTAGLPPRTCGRPPDDVERVGHLGAALMPAQVGVLPDPKPAVAELVGDLPDRQARLVQSVGAVLRKALVMIQRWVGSAAVDRVGDAAVGEGA
jgi:hypothetical protein